MEAKEFFEERERMLNSLGRTGGLCSGVFCGDCPLDGHCHTKESVDIVEKWSKEHPKKTCLDVLLEAFPNAPMTNGVPVRVCPSDIGLTVLKEDISNYCDSCEDCRDCWNQEYKEDK